MLVGTPVSDERKVTGLDSMVVDGTYFIDSSRKEILIGSKLAEKIHVKVGSKVVMMLQDANNEMVSGAFRVKGIYKTRNSGYDESMVFIPLHRMQELVALGDVSNELAVLLNPGVSLDLVRKQISSLAKNEEVMDWMGLSPELDLGIILLALMFGIVNTMLMVVLERQRELGMLMAIGMNRVRVFAMVMLETIWLAIVGGPLGLLLGHATIVYFGTHGVNLSQYSEALSMYGFSNIIYFQLDQKFYWPVLLMTVGVAVISAVYPAFKAVRLEPTQAIRKI
jgi:ABC-type lipoprotein release transport system permease subunit